MNKFESIVVTIGKDVAWPFTHGIQLLQLLDKALKDEPQAKQLIVGLVSQIADVSATGAIAVEAKGLDLPADLAELAAMKTLWSYVVTTFLPGIKTIYGDLAPVVDALTAANDATPAPALSADAQAGPGLHTQVAA